MTAMQLDKWTSRKRPKNFKRYRTKLRQNHWLNLSCKFIRHQQIQVGCSPNAHNILHEPEKLQQIARTPILLCKAIFLTVVLQKTHWLLYNSVGSLYCAATEYCCLTTNLPGYQSKRCIIHHPQIRWVYS